MKFVNDLLNIPRANTKPLILKKKKLSEIQKNFVSNVTHELKTPLATLSLATNTVQEKSPTRGEKYVEIINQETQRLEHRIEKVLPGSLLERKTNVVLKRIHLSSFLEKLMDRYSKQYQKQIIDWNVERYS